MSPPTGVDGILNYNKKSSEDYYAILGCDKSATVEQICAEYKVKALQHHPDKNKGCEESAKIIQKLNEAKEVLTDTEKRKVYDKWKNSGIAISFKNWLEMKDSVHQSLHWASVKTDGKMLESQNKNEDCGTSKEEEENLAYCSPSKDIGWKREPASDIIRKFRNYKI